MQFIDMVTVDVHAGDGGHGCVSFRHEKYDAMGGPDGGDGGNGGNVIFEADTSLETLLSLHRRKKITATRGKDGSGNNRRGARGDDVIVRVPVGTVIQDRQTNLILRDLTQPGEQVVVVRGGRGGFGNTHFASSTNQAPRQAQEGTSGERRELVLELKLLADVALVGLPNAGKSTLLSRLSAAQPKIADYPFTTLKPCLGIVELNRDVSITLVDLPGLIEGAHQGSGLGDQFLRHMQRCRVLCQVIDGAASDGLTPVEAFRIIDDEIKAYGGDLYEKPRLIVINKIDAVDNVELITQELKKITKCEILAISGLSGVGLDVLKNKLSDQLNEAL